MNLAEVVLGHPARARAMRSAASAAEAWHTWGEIRTSAASMAERLRGHGISPGDRVAMVLPTSVDFVTSYLGILATGAVAVPLNPSSPPAEIERELDAVGASLVISDDATSSFVPGLGYEVIEPVSKPDRFVADGARDLVPIERCDDELAVLLFTSGTAGDPKPAMLTHGNLLGNLRQMLALPGAVVTPDDVGLAAVPLFHVFGLNVALGLCLVTGAPLVLQERFDPQRAEQIVHDAGVTVLLGVPTMFQAWLSMDEEGSSLAQLGSVREAISGAAALDPALAARFEQRFGTPLHQGYGLTEASPVVCTSIGTGRTKPGSVGRPLPGVEVRLVDPSQDGDDDVLLGDPGEIWVRGPNVFVGYWGDQQATDQVLVQDGWLRTGDVGILDDDGDLYVVDRVKDLIIVSGFNVFPAEVERCIAAMPGIGEVAVIGVPDQVTGEAVEAVVVRKDRVGSDSEPAEADVMAWCARRLARYKCPTSVRFVPELPHGLVGKALRRALRADRKQAVSSSAAPAA